MMHRDKMKPKYALEDYIFEMESRSLEAANGGQAAEENLDVYTQLQQKEKDLILAAELGKALLEKNEELSRQNEIIAEEYSQKLELLEQDRHSLRRQLQALRSEAEARQLELQGDVTALASRLQQHDAQLRSTEREKTALVAELTDQNLRLAARLKESAKTEEQLTTQLQGLRDQCNYKKSSLQDHVSSMEALKDEVQVLSEKNAELDRRIHQMKEERDGLNAALDEATDRIMVLEHRLRENELQFRQAHREIEHLRIANGSLGDQLEALNSGSSAGTGHRSLLAEMECDDEAEAPLLTLDKEDHAKFKEEALSAYLQLKRLCVEMDQKSNDSINSEPESLSVEAITLDKFRTGLLSGAVSVLLSLIAREQRESSCSSSASVLEIEIELHRTQEQLEKLQKQLQEQADEIRRKNEEVLDLTSKISVREAELSGAREERDQARKDVDNTHMARDEVVRKAWEVRDGAVRRKNATEVELARTRIEVMQANSQLLEAIQQKVELSQQLEQWQMDMQALLDDQMRRKLTKQELRSNQTNTSDYESGSSSSGSSSGKKRAPTRRLFGLFQR